MPYAIVPFFLESLPFSTPHILFNSIFLVFTFGFFFCFSFSFVPHTAHFDSHSITHPMCVCVRLRYECTYDNLHTYSGPGDKFIQVSLLLVDSLRMRLVSLLVCVCVCEISQTLILITRDMWYAVLCGSMFGSPFVILSCCFFLLFLLAMESVFLMDSNVF